MALMQMNTNPSDGELRLFGWGWLGFVSVVSATVWLKPLALLSAAVMMSAACVISLVFNDSTTRLRQLWAGTLPAVFGALSLAVMYGLAASMVASIFWGVGLAVGLGVLRKPVLARRVYHHWATTVEPIGWSMSYVILIIVFYLLITPLGLIRRCVWGDPLERSLDRGAHSYWTKRPLTDDIKRYYRQF